MVQIGVLGVGFAHWSISGLEAGGGKTGGDVTDSEAEMSPYHFSRGAGQSRSIEMAFEIFVGGWAG